MAKTKYNVIYGDYFYLKTLHDESGRELKIFAPVVETGKYIIEWKVNAPTEHFDYVSVLIQFNTPYTLRSTDDTYNIINVFRHGRNYKSPKMTNKYRLVIDKIAAQIRS